MRRGRKPTRKMARGGRTRPVPKRGAPRKMAHGGPHGGGSPAGPGGCGPGMMMSADGSCIPSGNGGGYRKGGKTRPAPKRMAKGGAARRPVRKMGAGGTCGGTGQPPCGGMRAGGRTLRKPGRGGRLQTGGQVCPAGTERTADGRCTPMGS